jgi:hypothetical protein
MIKTFIIAEAGVNHNGSLETAKELIDVAVDAGVDAVKFQTFKSDKTISIYAPKAEYQKRTTAACESQLDMVRKLELNEAAHEELINHCSGKDIVFISTPFDLESIALLDNLGLEFLNPVWRDHQSALPENDGRIEKKDNHVDWDGHTGRNRSRVRCAYKKRNSTAEYNYTSL